VIRDVRATTTFDDELSKLTAVCAMNNQTIVNVKSDGNCMFSALAIQLGLEHNDEASRKVRAEVVSYIRSHPSMVSSVYLIEYVCYLKFCRLKLLITAVLISLFHVCVTRVKNSYC